MDPTSEPNKPVEASPQLQAQPLAQSQAPAKIQIAEKNEEANAQYAEALINMVNFEYGEQHPKQAKHTRVISDKMGIIIVVLILITILGTVVMEQFNKSSPAAKSSTSSSSSDSSASNQLIKSAGSFSNQSSY